MEKQGEIYCCFWYSQNCIGCSNEYPFLVVRDQRCAHCSRPYPPRWVEAEMEWARGYNVVE